MTKELKREIITAIHRGHFDTAHLSNPKKMPERVLDLLYPIIKRLELEARVDEHKGVCDDCNWNNEGGLCDRAQEFQDILRGLIDLAEGRGKG